MDSFFDFVKGTGRAFYEFVLYIVTLLAVLSLIVFVPASIKPAVMLGVFFMAIMWLSTGRIMTFASILLMVGALANNGNLSW